ncbi:hypothetical protein ACRJ4B_10500 [Streptomyces sp. GTA36]
MRIDVYIPLVLSLLLATVAPQVGRRVAPALAARVLTVAAVLTAAATTWALILLAATLINEAPPVAAEAREDGRHLPEPVPEIIAVAAILALALIAHRTYRALRTEYATRRTLQRLCEGHPPDTELIVAASPVPQAFAIPATSTAPGRILVTAAMLGALQPPERRVLLLRPRTRPPHPPPRPVRVRPRPRHRGQPPAHPGAYDRHLPRGTVGRRTRRRGRRRPENHRPRPGQGRPHRRAPPARLRAELLRPRRHPPRRRPPDHPAPAPVVHRRGRPRPRRPPGPGSRRRHRRPT